MTAKPKKKQATREGLQESATRAGTLPRFVRAQVIAAMLDVTPRCVTLWAADGKIPSIRVGGTVRFDPAAVLGALNREEAR